MKTLLLTLTLSLFSLPALAQSAELGKAAPDFTLTDTTGKAHNLAALAGKTVVLEWFNPDCPFVVYAHGKNGPLRKHEALGREGLVWLAINSGAAGKQGAGLDRNKKAVSEYAIGYPVLLDESGDVGRSYGAKSTPHMMIIDPAGKLVYRGALDNAPLGDVKGSGARVDYVVRALDELAAGAPLTDADNKSYGCSVKYDK